MTSFDYGEAEKCVLALNDLGGDIHRRVAAELFEKSEAEVTEEERRSVKTINFGLVYGMSLEEAKRRLFK